MLRDPESSKFAPISKFKDLGLGEKSYSNADLEKALGEFSKPAYNAKVCILSLNKPCDFLNLNFKFIIIYIFLIQFFH
jgi:hypothetical protein